MDDPHHPGRMQQCAERFFEWARPRLAERYLVMINAELHAVDWDDETPRLLGHTTVRLRRTSGFRNLRGMTEHDYVQDAVTLIASGARHWYRTNRKPFLDFVTSVIDSLVSGEHMRKEDRIQHLALSTDKDEKQAGTCSEWQLPGRPAGQEDEILEQQLLERYLAKLPEPVREYASLLAAGTAETAAECAEALSTTEAEIRNRRRALLRRRDQWDNR